MQVLIVGAGAIGQVYGYHLQRAGHEVVFYIKPHHREGLAEGLALYPYNRRAAQRCSPVKMSGYELLDDPQQVADRSWDQLWLCVSAPALDGDWLPRLLEAAARATVVTLQPGLHSRDRVIACSSEDRVVSGMIGMWAWQAPLGDEPVSQPGTAYWFPPLSPTLFSGPSELTSPVVRALRDGGCPARSTADATRAAARGSAVLMPLVAALELYDWSLAKLRRQGLADAVRACREALAVVSRHHGGSPGLLGLLLRAALLRPAMVLAPRLVPLDLERYLAVHFGKTADQTRASLDDYVARGAELGIATPTIEQIARRLGNVP